MSRSRAGSAHLDRIRGIDYNWGMRFRAGCCAAVLLFTVQALPARAEVKKMLISPESLAGQLNDPSLVLLHVGAAKDYEAGHIPGARLISLPDISVTDERGMRLQLPSVDSLRKAFGKLGISDSSKIVVYPAAESIQSATRVWFTLDYLGLGDRSALLDGGLTLWKAQGRPISTETPSVTPADFTPHVRSDVVVDADWIQSRIGTGRMQVYDARLPEFYSGANAGGMPRAGHIPGAVSLPYVSLVEDTRKLRSSEAIAGLMNAKPSVPVVTYCHIGQQATVLYFTARYLGLDAKLYDGSFQDWSSRPEVPVDSNQR